MSVCLYSSVGSIDVNASVGNTWKSQGIWWGPEDGHPLSRTLVNPGTLPELCKSSYGHATGLRPWPLLFSCYISPTNSPASSFGINTQEYADDTQIYINCLTASDLVAELSWLSSCLSALQNWFCHNGLVINSSKSGTRQRLHSFPTVSSPTISGSTITHRSQGVKHIGHL